MAIEVIAAATYFEPWTFLLWSPNRPTSKNEAANSIIKSWYSITNLSIFFLYF